MLPSPHRMLNVTLSLGERARALSLWQALGMVSFWVTAEPPKPRCPLLSPWGTEMDLPNSYPLTNLAQRILRLWGSFLNVFKKPVNLVGEKWSFCFVLSSWW